MPINAPMCYSHFVQPLCNPPRAATVQEWSNLYRGTSRAFALSGARNQVRMSLPVFSAGLLHECRLVATIGIAVLRSILFKLALCRLAIKWLVRLPLF